MEVPSRTLWFFCGETGDKNELDNQVLTLLGEHKKQKRWLAASLAKTLRLQLNLPKELRKLFALDGPVWIDSDVLSIPV
jgi:hypothetical protein